MTILITIEIEGLPGYLCKCNNSSNKACLFLGSYIFLFQKSNFSYLATYPNYIQRHLCLVMFYFEYLHPL